MPQELLVSRGGASSVTGPVVFLGVGCVAGTRCAVMASCVTGAGYVRKATFLAGYRASCVPGVSRAVGAFVLQ